MNGCVWPVGRIRTSPRPSAAASSPSALTLTYIGPFARELEDSTRVFSKPVCQPVGGLSRGRGPIPAGARVRAGRKAGVRLKPDTTSQELPAPGLLLDGVDARTEREPVVDRAVLGAGPRVVCAAADAEGRLSAGLRTTTTYQLRTTNFRRPKTEDRRPTAGSRLQATGASGYGPARSRLRRRSPCGPQPVARSP